MSAFEAPTKTPDGPERMTYMMQYLRSSVLCPVCLDVPSSGPIFICPNGHSVCSTCKRNKCPTCRAAMGSIRNRVAEMVINVIDHECSHDGCAEQIPLSQLHQHEEDCPFKPILCPGASCNKFVIMKHFVSHLQRKHLLSEEFGELSGSFVVEKGNIHYIRFPLDHEGRNSRKCWVVSSEERFIVLSLKINNEVKLNVFLIGRKEDLNNYKVELSVKTKIYWDQNAVFKKEREVLSFSLKYPPNDFEIENKGKAMGLFIPKDMLDDADCVEVCLRFVKLA